MERREEIPVNCHATKVYLTQQFASQPVHEVISRSAYNRVYGRHLGVKNWASPFISGVVWNDDPEWLVRKSVYGKGIEKLMRFADLAEKGKQHPNDPSLFIRSHYGDLQFLHAMKPDGQSQADTMNRLRNWVVGAHKVATEKIDPSTPISETELGKAVGELTCGGNKSCSVAQLFDRHRSFQVHGASTRDKAAAYRLNIRWIAAGSVLHVLQDSFSAAHTRVVTDVDKRKLRILKTYDKKNQDVHCESDMATQSTRKSIKEAEDASFEYLKLFRSGAAPEEVLKLLDELGLRVPDTPAPAAATAALPTSHSQPQLEDRIDELACRQIRVLDSKLPRLQLEVKSLVPSDLRLGNPGSVVFRKGERAGEIVAFAIAISLEGPSQEIALQSGLPLSGAFHIEAGWDELREFVDNGASSMDIHLHDQNSKLYRCSVKDLDLKRLVAKH